jgi:hypothetical protein
MAKKANFAYASMYAGHIFARSLSTTVESNINCGAVFTREGEFWIPYYAKYEILLTFFSADE